MSDFKFMEGLDKSNQFLVSVVSHIKIRKTLGELIP